MQLYHINQNAEFGYLAHCFDEVSCILSITEPRDFKDRFASLKQRSI